MLHYTNRNELLDDVIKYIDSMVDDIEIDKRNEELDHYETARHLNLIAMKLSYINEQIASQVIDLEIDARDHEYMRDVYFDKLNMLTHGLTRCLKLSMMRLPRLTDMRSSPIINHKTSQVRMLPHKLMINLL